jgi:polyphenol oxidase
MSMKREPFTAALPGRDQQQPSMLFLSEWMREYPWLAAGITTRHGGVSGAPWTTQNCALHVGDVEGDVIENRKRASGAAGFDFAAWTCAEQVHGSEIAVVRKERRGAGRLRREDSVGDKDGMITNTPGIMLAAFYADCVPLWFVDPANKAVGIAHAGWKGTVGHIAAKAVKAFVDTFGSDPSRMLAAIGPSIGACCYEVDDYVIDQVKEAGGTPGVEYVPAASNGRYMLNLSKFNANQLLKAGILLNHIEITGYCTSCRSDLFYSHRKEQGRTGRMAAWIAIKDEVTQG